MSCVSPVVFRSKHVDNGVTRAQHFLDVGGKSGIIGAQFDNEKPRSGMGAHGMQRVDTFYSVSLASILEDSGVCTLIVLCVTCSFLYSLGGWGNLYAVCNCCDAPMQAPSVMEYLSLDIEGAEFFVMQHFPFDKYKFLTLTVERPKQLRKLLEDNNYVYVKDHGECGALCFIVFRKMLVGHAINAAPNDMCLRCKAFSVIDVRLQKSMRP